MSLEDLYHTLMHHKNNHTVYYRQPDVQCQRHRIPRMTPVVSSCVLYPLCVLYVFKNVGNNIKRGKKHENQNDITSSHVHASREYVSRAIMLFPTFLENKYKTHRGYRTHELTTQVSSCVLYPLCVLYFTNSNCKIYLGRIK